MPLYKNQKQTLDAITKVLDKDQRVIFVYLYGSIVAEGQGNDIDIAVYTDPSVDSESTAVDLQIELHRETGLPPEAFDIRNLEDIIENGDVLGLLYLKNVVDGGLILINKKPDVRAGFLERYGFKFRECEGLIQEVLA